MCILRLCLALLKCFRSVSYFLLNYLHLQCLGLKLRGCHWTFHYPSLHSVLMWVVGRVGFVSSSHEKMKRQAVNLFELQPSFPARSTLSRTRFLRGSSSSLLAGSSRSLCADLKRKEIIFSFNFIFKKMSFVLRFKYEI